MHRSLLALTLVACAGDRAAIDPPIARVAPDAAIVFDAASSPDARAVVAVDAAAPPRVEVPKDVHGDLFVSYGDEKDAAHIYATTIGPDGAAPLRRLTTAPGVVDEPVDVTAEGLVFLRTLPNDTGAARVIATVQRDGTGERELARCARVCDGVVVGADGRVHYIDHHVTQLGTIKDVSLKGGDARVWKGNATRISACWLAMTITNDRKKLLLWANNTLGWPECKGAVQGIYALAVDAMALGKPLQPTRAEMGGDELHSAVQEVFVRPDSDRIFFVADVVATKSDPRPTALFSCNAKGGDLRREADKGAWSIATTDTSVVARKAGVNDVALLGDLTGVRAILSPGHMH